MQLHVKTRILAFVHKIPDSTEEVSFAGKKQTEKGNIYLSKIFPQMIEITYYSCVEITVHCVNKILLML